jgi:hypothetical protein
LRVLISLRREMIGPMFNIERDQWGYRDSIDYRIEDPDWEVTQPLGEKGVCITKNCLS